MFNFDNVKKLIHYDWNNMIEDTVPKNNQEKMDRENYNDIFNGCILKIIAEVLNVIYTLGIAYFISRLTSNLFDGVNLFNSDVSISLPFQLILTIGTLIYISAMKDKNQASTFHFIIACLLFINTITKLLGIVACFGALFINPILAVIGFISLMLTLLGNINIIVGCIDFCQKTKKAYKEKNTIKPIDSKISTSPIKTSDVSEHSVNICLVCGAKNNSSANFCKNCGNKF